MTNGTKKQLQEYGVAQGIASEGGYYKVTYSRKDGFYIWHASNGADMKHLPTLCLSTEDILAFLNDCGQEFFDYIEERKKSALMGHIAAFKKEIEEIEEAL